MIVVLTGTAPDGSPLEVSVDLDQDDDDRCPATWGDGLPAYCTLDRDHPGPWHVATTDESIIKAWPAGGDG